MVAAEDLRIGVEGEGGATPVGGGADFLDGTKWRAARERLRVEFFVAGDLDIKVIRQRVDDGTADAVQAARGFIGFAVELSARMQGAENDFERGLVGKFRVRIDRDATAIVAHGERAVGMEFDLDAVGVACDGFVHRIVDDFGGKVVVGALVNATDIHAGAEADGL